MTNAYVITATDTDVGKTLVSALLMRALNARYWKPVQAGLEGATDTQTVKRLTGFGDDRFFPETYRLRQPLSPHLAAEKDGVAINPARLNLPACPDTLLVEGAGGLMVPLTNDFLMIDLFASWNRPVILCARTALGTINHTLLSVQALKERGIPLHGIVFTGADMPDTVRTIAGMTGARILAHIPPLPAVTPAAIAGMAPQIFNEGDFT